MRRLFQYLYREKLRRRSPRGWRLPSCRSVCPDLSEAQVDALLQAPCVDRPLGNARQGDARSVRHRAAGSELVGLSISDVSLRQGVVRVIGKGNKERLVPLGEEAVYWIENYLEHGRPWLVNSQTLDVLFPAPAASK